MQEEGAQGVWAWLESSAAASAVRESLWLYPAVEIAHIIGFVVLVGAAFMFDLRLLGFGRQLHAAALARHLLRWSRAALLVVVPTGLLMFSAGAVKFSESPVFRLKLLLIVAAGVNAAVFRLWPGRSIEVWGDAGRRVPAPAKASALLSLSLWAGVISCGRLISFF